MDQKPPLDEVIRILGGVTSCAAKLGLKNYQTLQQWRKAGVPAEYCPTIERATDGAVRCEDLRPDVEWGYLRGTVRDDCTESSCANCRHAANCELRLAERRKPEQRTADDRRADQPWKGVNLNAR